MLRAHVGSTFHGQLAGHLYDSPLAFIHICLVTMLISKNSSQIWITARKAGLRSYVDMWVGSFAEYNGTKPNIVFKYNGSKTFQAKIDGVIANMDSENDTIR